jgi:predicted O-linked N-acetylglucosamine transferase (SPINDLY family)
MTSERNRLLQTAMLHQRAGRFCEAEKAYKRVLKHAPDDFDCAYLLGMHYAQQGNLRAAIDLFRRAVKSRPDVADVQYNLAVALGMIGSHREAALFYERILQADPEHAAARNNYATTLLQLGLAEDAVHQYDRLIARYPGAAEAYNNRGMALQRARRLEEALGDFDKAIALNSKFPEAHVNRGNILSALRRPGDAVGSYNRAIALRPDLAEAYSNIANIEFQRSSYADAISAFDRALTFNQNDSEARAMRLYAKLHLCDWGNFDEERARVLADIGSGSLVYPFICLALTDSLNEQLRCARSFGNTRYPRSEQPLWHGATYTHDRVRVAYLSADFREHATANLLVGIFEHHDRSRFEVTGLSFGPDDDSAMALRIKSACERFIDVREKSDRQIAELVRQLEIDIAVDAMGYTQGARTEIFARRPAPIQASYLGYLGTMGAEFIDYVIADATVAPFDQQRFFDERIVHLPGCLLAVDDRLAAPGTPGRSELGLPETGFVFCSFNNSYKFTKTGFQSWMRLLRKVDGSVLWLLESNSDMTANLRREAERCGVDDARLIFAPRLPLSRHLARQRVADLFLDTTPYNAGATAALALWSGVPLVTIMGETIVARMAASMLRAVGAPELITTSWSDYEVTAHKIAAEPELCASLKAKLRRARDTSVLFDTARFTRQIEAAYSKMSQLQRQGEPPRSFVADSSPQTSRQKF